MNLTLGFEQTSPEIAGLAPPLQETTSAARASSPIPGLVQRFEVAMREDESPVRALRHDPARQARFGEVPSELNPGLMQALKTRGIEQLYRSSIGCG